MRKNIAKPINKRTGVMALLLVLATPLLTNSCSTGTEPDEPVNLEGTSWELTSIEAIDDSVFQQFENEIWEVPDDQTYSIAFKDSFIVIQADYCESCAAWYTVTPKDSIELDLQCHADVVCNKNLEFKYRLSATQTFSREASFLHLHYYWPDMEGILHFEEMETEE